MLYTWRAGLETTAEEVAGPPCVHASALACRWTPPFGWLIFIAGPLLGAAATAHTTVPSAVMASYLCSCLPPAARKSLAISFAYGAISMTLALVNKALLSSYKFECYFFLLATQMRVGWRTRAPRWVACAAGDIERGLATRSF